MSPLAFLRGRGPEALWLVMCAVLVCGLLLLMGLPVAEVAFVLILLLMGGLGMVLMEWMRMRRFLEDLSGVASSDSNALSLASGLRVPEHPEGVLAWRAIGAVVHDANARIGELRVREADYRDYIETWVHEVKTPLAAADLMLDNMKGVSTHPLRQELDEVNAYVEQALYYARSSDVERDFLVRPCELRRLVGDALKSRASQLIGCGMGVDLSGVSEGPHEVICDQKWVVFILGQLIDNAVRYRAEASVRQPRLSFSTRLQVPDGTEAPRALLDVLDNGMGISAEDVGRVFDRGFTGANGRSRKKSTGLGLYLVRTLCDKMGLGIAVTSLPGAWTCFTISFPLPGDYDAEVEVGPVG